MVSTRQLYGALHKTHHKRKHSTENVPAASLHPFFVERGGRGRERSSITTQTSAQDIIVRNL